MSQSPSCNTSDKAATPHDPVDDDNFICEGCRIESDIENSIRVAGLYFCDGCAGDITDPAEIELKHLQHLTRG